jgi:hypothetical protein
VRAADAQRYASSEHVSLVSQNMTAMPPTISEIYDPLYQDVCRLHAKWQLFRQLYADDEQNVELLNESAPKFFRTCQDMLVDDVLLTISRLADPPESIRKKNLSLDQLVIRINATANPLLKNRLERAIKEAVKECGFARVLRHKRIAHSDLATKLKTNVEPLPTVTLNKIEAALTGIRSVMNIVEDAFQNCAVRYELLAVNDGNIVLARLREAKKYREHRRQK